MLDEPEAVDEEVLVVPLLVAVAGPLLPVEVAAVVDLPQTSIVGGWSLSFLRMY